MPRKIDGHAEENIIELLYDEPMNFNKLLREIRARHVLSDPSVLSRVLSQLVEDGRLQFERKAGKRGIPMKVFSLTKKQRMISEISRIQMEFLDPKSAFEALISLIEKDELKPLETIEPGILTKDSAERFKVVSNAVYASHECLRQILSLRPNLFIKAERTERQISIAVKRAEE